MKRHNGLTLQTPKLLSVYRAKFANPDVVDNWFDIYKSVIEENKIESCLNIWNVDECGCIDMPNPHKVVTVANKRANQLASSENGETTTFLTFCNAAGMHTKPTVIHKGTKVMNTWQIGRPKGFSIGASENGWITNVYSTSMVKSS